MFMYAVLVFDIKPTYSLTTKFSFQMFDTLNKIWFGASREVADL